MDELVFDQKEAIGAWVAQQVGQTCEWGSFYSLGIVRDGEIIAGVVFNNFNGANATCHIAISKFSRVMPAMIEHSCRYAFEFCGLKRLTGMVPSNEPKILAFDKHLGFEEEFVMKDGAPGADMHVLVMWPDKCRWLRKE
jgi:RimJ/RimL family protein N-acetyltransferase